MHNHKRGIHKELRKHVPHGIHKAKKIFAFKYPKLLLLTVIIIASYFIFSNEIVSAWFENLEGFGYFGTFIAGILAAFGFTAPIGVGILIKLNLENPILGALIGGVGASFGDWIIFKTIKFSFMDEFQRLKEVGAIRKIRKIAHRNKHILIKHYLLYIFAGIMIATPLPDEIGVSMLAGLTTIRQIKLAIISFILHTSAIFLILNFI